MVTSVLQEATSPEVIQYFETTFNDALELKSTDTDYLVNAWNSTPRGKGGGDDRLHTILSESTSAKSMDFPHLSIGQRGEIKILNQREEKNTQAVIPKAHEAPAQLEIQAAVQSPATTAPKITPTQGEQNLFNKLINFFKNNDENGASAEPIPEVKWTTEPQANQLNVEDVKALEGIMSHSPYHRLSIHPSQMVDKNTGNIMWNISPNEGNYFFSKTIITAEGKNTVTTANTPLKDGYYKYAEGLLDHLALQYSYTPEQIKEMGQSDNKYKEDIQFNVANIELKPQPKSHKTKMKHVCIDQNKLPFKRMRIIEAHSEKSNFAVVVAGKFFYGSAPADGGRPRDHMIIEFPNKEYGDQIVALLEHIGNNVKLKNEVLWALASEHGDLEKKLSRLRNLNIFERGSLHESNILNFASLYPESAFSYLADKK